jgi:hypothetical protein
MEEKKMLDLCWLCETHPIYSVKRPLCEGCYKACRKKNLLHIFPLTNENSRARAIERFGCDFLPDMETLREGKATLTAIGGKYGVSRERIRQLFEIVFSEKYTTTVTVKKDIASKKRKAADTEKHIFENRLNRAKKSGNSYTGLLAEELFRKKCIDLGFSIEMCRGGFAYDAIVNGIPVDIKSRTEAALYCKKGAKQKYYHFSTNKIQRGKVRFFPFYLIDEDLWYIIPSGIVKCEAFYIPKYDITYAGSHKYQDLQKYREAWNLLETNLLTS